MPTHQQLGIKKISEDFKTLGFRKMPHETSMRAKQYDLNRTANFQSTFQNNEMVSFLSSFNNGYDLHRGSFVRNQAGLNHKDSKKSMVLVTTDMFQPDYKNSFKSKMQVQNTALQAMKDRNQSEVGRPDRSNVAQIHEFRLLNPKGSGGMRKQTSSNSKLFY